VSFILREHASEHAFMHFSFLLGNHTSRPLSCCFGICGFKNGKRRAGIGVAAKCQEVRRPLRVLLLSDSSFFVALHRWFKEISSRPAWLAIKDVDLTSNYNY